MNEQSDKSRNKNVREAEKQIVRSAFLALAALAVIVFACYAWFVSSGTVTGKVGAVRIDGSSFELGSMGEKADKYDKLFPTTPAPPVDGDNYDPNDQSGTVTGENTNIFWRVSSDSNLGNTDSMTGVSPGSFGTLQFYVIPKRDGTLNLTFNVSLVPIREDGTQVTMNDAREGGDSTLNKLLRGHFLFSYSCEEVNASNVQLAYNNHSFRLTFSNAKENHPIEVTLDWLWPEFLRDVIENEQTGTVIQGWMSAEPDHFFYNGVSPIGDVDFDNDFRKLNSYYNNADEYIGTNIKGVILSLTAEET